MRYFILFSFFFNIAFSVMPSNMIRTQKELKNIILYKSSDKIQKKKLLFAIYNYSLKLKNKKQTFLFFKSLTNLNKFKQLRPIIYYLMSKYKSGKDKKFFLLKSKLYSKDTEDLIFSLKNLTDFFQKYNIDYKDLYFLLYIKKLINIQENTKDNKGLEQSFYKLGKFYMEKFDYINAVNNFANSIQYSRMSKGAFSGYSYLEIANIFYIIDNKTLMEKFLNKALLVSKTANNKKLLAEIYFFYSKDYYNLKKYKNALKYIYKIENILNNKYNKKVLFLKANVLFMLGKKDKSQIILKKILSNELKNKHYKNLINIIGFYTELLIDMNKLNEAKKYILLLDDIYAPFYRYYFYYYYLKALILEKQNKKSASIFYNKALNKIKKFYNSIKQHNYHKYKNDINKIYYRFIRYTIKSKNSDYIKKFLYLNELKNISYNRKIIKKIIKKKYISELNKLIIKKEFKFLKNNDLTDLFKLKNDYKYNYKIYNYNDLNIKKIQSNLNIGQIIIRFIILDQDLYIVYITKKNFNIKHLPKVMPIISNLIYTFSHPIDEFKNGKVDYLRTKFNTQISFKLYNLLLKDILIKEKINELLIIPDAILFKIPFESLITHENLTKNKKIFFSEYNNYNYLIQKYSISYYFSIFQFLKKINNFKYNKKYKFLFLGDPVIKGKIQNLFKPLKSINNELKYIKSIFKKKTLFFTKKNFLISNFKKFSSRSEIIHIATHHIYNKNDPLFSSLLFSKNKNSNQFLYAKEISNCKLNNSLIILSACESSEKNLIGTEGISGIISAFKNSGAKSIIVSLWPVDEFNSLLIPLFYKYLRKYKIYNKKNISKALQIAKIQFIKKIYNIGNKQKFSFSNPFLWSNFIIYNLN